MKTSGCWWFAHLLVFSLFLAGCEISDPIADPPSEEDPVEEIRSASGFLKLLVCDSPFPVSEIEKAEVTFIRGEIRIAGDTLEDPFLTVFEDTMLIDLLAFRNGRMAELGFAELDTGAYDQIRLFISRAKLTLKNESRMFLVKVPSGESSGIKVIPDTPIIIGSGSEEELLLDFDLDQSFVVLGNPDTPAGIKGFIFKPVIRAALLEASGSAEGIVSDLSGEPVENASVWIQSNTLVSKTYSEADGYFAFPGIAPGRYQIFATAAFHDTVKKSIEIVTAKSTIADFSLAPVIGDGITIK